MSTPDCILFLELSCASLNVPSRAVSCLPLIATWEPKPSPRPSEWALHHRPYQQPNKARSGGRLYDNYAGRCLSLSDFLKHERLLFSLRSAGLQKVAAEIRFKSANVSVFIICCPWQVPVIAHGHKAQACGEGGAQGGYEGVRKAHLVSQCQQRRSPERSQCVDFPL